jgi:hypothetical protein
MLHSITRIYPPQGINGIYNITQFCIATLIRLSVKLKD